LILNGACPNLQAAPGKKRAPFRVPCTSETSVLPEGEFLVG
jgi:hypothetical protein